ncbi:hypothetical protein [Nocardia sp. NPDC058705]|uniref:hypothetical protein n=1 Tax=Nocardia sp. NPDC058705 TaxID=3346609 RepID=UPI0036BC0C8D
MATITRSSNWINLVGETPAGFSPSPTYLRNACAMSDSPEVLAKLTDNTAAFALSLCLVVAIAVIASLVMAIGHSLSGSTKIQAALRSATAFGATFIAGLTVITVFSLLP